MLKTLLKKQMLELNRGFFYNQKNGAARSKASCIVMIVLFALLMVGFLGGLFTYLAFSICGPLVEANVGWLYFSIFGLLSLALGVLGSVFNTYSGLYLAKDNELLLSLPIPVRYLLTVRLLGVYLMGLMYSAVAILPAVVVYYIVVPVDIAGIVGPVVLTLLLSLLVLFLSCLLGWVVAKLSTKLKSKSFISALLALAFIAAYYFVYFKASALLRELVQNAAIYGDRIHAKAYLLYLIGRVGEGDWLSMLLLTLIVAILLGATLYVLAKTFLQIATAQGGVAKAVYKAAPVRRKSVFSALLSKELRCFSSSANYMLNCGLSTLLLFIAAVALLIKGQTVAAVLLDVFDGNLEFITILLVGGVCMLTAMNDMATPSVSLEGKSIWIVQSLPIDTWQALKAKLSVQLLLTGIPVFLCSIAVALTLRPDALTVLLVILLPLLYVCFSACLDLFLGLQSPNLNWTSELHPIKSSVSVLLALLAGWIYSIVLIAVYYFVGARLGAAPYLGVCCAITLLVTLPLYGWLKRRGSIVFRTL